MKAYFLRFLAAYDYKSFDEFLLSLFPTFKYQIQSLMLTISFISGVVNYFLGITPALAIAMFAAVVAEVYTGIKASKKLKKPFESFRFSRCVIKIGIWIVILYIIHAFEKDYSSRTNWIEIAAYGFFKFAFVATLSGFLVEYLTSILENVSVLMGKPKTDLIEAISGAWKNLLSFTKPKSNEN